MNSTMDEIELRQPGYVAELIEVFNKAKKNSENAGERVPSGGVSIFGGSSGSAHLADDAQHSRTTESLSEATSSFSRDLPIFLSEPMQRSSSSCVWSSPDGHSDSAEHCSIDVFATLRPPTKCVCVCNEKNCEYVKRHGRGSSPVVDWRSSKSEDGNKSPHISKVFTLLRERKSQLQPDELNKSKSLTSRWWKKGKQSENSLSRTDVSEKFRIPANTSPQILTPISLTSPPLSITPIDTYDFSVSEMPTARTNGASATAPEIITLRRLRPSDERSAPHMTHSNTNGSVPHPHEDEEDTISSTSSEERLTPKTRVRSWVEHWRLCKYKPSPIRITFLVIGSILFLAGVSYDFCLQHAVHGILGSCRNNLADEYIEFGNKFLTYNYIFESVRSRRHSDLFYDQSDISSNPAQYWSSIADKDPKFFKTLEALAISVELNFFNLVDSLSVDKVKVKDLGPLYLRVDFSRHRGFRVNYVPSRSNVSLSTPFHVYDLMKLMLESNNMLHLGFHMKDYHVTTPTALLNVVVDVLQKFRISTVFLESLQNQTRWTSRRRRSRQEVEDVIQWKSYEDILRNIFLTFPPNRNTIVSVPVSVLHKNVTFRFEETSFTNGLECLKFTHDRTGKISKKTKYVSSSSEKWDVRRNNQNMFAVKYKEEETDPYLISNQYPMVIDLESAIQGVVGNTKLFGETLEKYPLWISSPHFLTSDRKSVDGSLDSNLPKPIDGFYPSRKQHGSFIHYHPVLGAPMNASLALQFGVRPPMKMLHGGKIVPVFWVRLQLESVPSSLWFFFWFVTHLRLIMIGILVCVGLLLICLTALCRCSREPAPVFV